MSEDGASRRVRFERLESSTSLKGLENLYAVRGAVLAHLSGSGESRAVWICPWQDLHDPCLNSGIGVDLRSRLYLARSHSDLHHMRSREIQPRSQVDPDACNETRSVQRLPRRCPYCPGSSRTAQVSEYGYVQVLVENWYIMCASGARGTSRWHVLAYITCLGRLRPC